MEKSDYESFITNLYSYCDNHVGERVLLPAFVNLWNGEFFNGDEKEEITKQKKYVNTCRLVNKLVSDKILKEVPKQKGFESIYPRYQILKHEDLIWKED
jgi:hypothetical protein